MLPDPQAGTRWNALTIGDDIVEVMRDRMRWVYRHLTPPAPIVKDDMQSGGSKAWVVRCHLPAPVPGYIVAAEIEDRSARGWPAHLEAGARNPVKGPRVWVGLRQHDVDGSEGFDWGYLVSLWPLMNAAQPIWVTGRQRFRTEHDRVAWQRVGGPPELGYGFGHQEAVNKHVCMFGGRVPLPADIAPLRDDPALRVRKAATRAVMLITRANA